MLLIWYTHDPTAGRGLHLRFGFMNMCARLWHTQFVAIVAKNWSSESCSQRICTLTPYLGHVHCDADAVASVA